MRTQLTRKFYAGLLGGGFTATDGVNIGTAAYGIIKDVFDIGTKQPYAAPNQSGQLPYTTQAPPTQQPQSDVIGQYLPIALIGLLGIGAIMAFKK